MESSGASQVQLLRLPFQKVFLNEVQYPSTSAAGEEPTVPSLRRLPGPSPRTLSPRTPLPTEGHLVLFTIRTDKHPIPSYFSNPILP